MPRQLEAIISEWSKAGHGNGIDVLSAEIYVCTTRNWLMRLERRSDSTYAYHVICNFLELFHTISWWVAWSIKVAMSRFIGIGIAGFQPD